MLEEVCMSCRQTLPRVILRAECVFVIRGRSFFFSHIVALSLPFCYRMLSFVLLDVESHENTAALCLVCPVSCLMLSWLISQLCPIQYSAGDAVMLSKKFCLAQGLKVICAVCEMSCC